MFERRKIMIKIDKFLKNIKDNINPKDISNIKSKINEAKDIYNNYNNLDNEEKEEIKKWAKDINQEQFKEFKENFILALKYLDELMTETNEYYQTVNSHFADEINKKANEKNVREKKNEIFIDYFKTFENKVSATLKVFNERTDISEDNMYDVSFDLFKHYLNVLEIYDNLNNEERDMYYESLNNTCQKFYNIIKIYNNIANSSLSLLHRPIELDFEKTIDITNTKMGITSNNKLDLFTIIHYKEERPLYGRYTSFSYDEGEIYQGILTNEIAIKRSHISLANVDSWASIKGGQMYNNRMYCATTDILKPSKDYEYMRNRYYKDHKIIKPYHKSNTTTIEELEQVIDYGTKLYELKPNKTKVK